MMTNKIAPVARVFPKSAIATLPWDRFSPIIPEPITVAMRKKVPMNSEAYFLKFI